MIAMVIMGIAMMALASVAAASLVQVRNSRSRQQAVDAASTAIETLRLSEFSAVAMDPTDPAVQALGSCAGSFDEPIVTSALGDTVQYEQSAPGNISVRTVVTWYDEDDDDACTDADHDRTVKRVTATATWVDAGGSRQVRETTLVSHVERGLAAPDFRLGTPEVAVDLSQAASEVETCVGHVLRNLGAQDSYEWTIDREGGATLKPASDSEYEAADGRWTVRAFFEFPAGATALNPAALPGLPNPVNPLVDTLPEGIDLMRDLDGNGLPEAVDGTTLEPVRLDSGDAARIWICYRALDPTKITTTGTSDVAVTIKVQSRFDPNMFQTAGHVIDVLPAGTESWYLFDDESSSVAGADGPRYQKIDDAWVLPYFSMGPTGANQPDVLDTTATIPDRDNDLQTPDGSGLLLADDLPYNRPHEGHYHYFTPADSGSVSWDRRVETDDTNTASATFDPAGLELWVSSRDLRSGSATARAIELRARLDVLDSTKSSTVSTPVGPATVISINTSSSFQGVAVPAFAAAGEFTVGDNQVLRLTVECVEVQAYDILTATSSVLPDGDEDQCVLSYDHADTPARLLLVEVL